MTQRTKTLRCPTCRTLVQAKDEHFPFCSVRCTTIDLGKWASGAYKVSSPIDDPEVLERIESGAAAKDLLNNLPRKRSS